LPTLNGIKKHTWSNNRLLLHRACEEIPAFEAAGIQVMVLKGAALSIEYYRDHSLRPMDDVDFLVRYADADAAIEILRRRGWRLQDDWAEKNGLGAQAREYYHGKCLIHPSGSVIDLHWNLLQLSLGPEADADFWAASRETMFNGRRIRILHPTDHLLHTCVHGASWDWLAPIRWIPDAAVILNKEPQFDWERLQEQARKRKLTLIVRGALEYIESNLGGFVPARVLAELRTTRVTFFETIEYREHLKPLSGVFGTMPRALCGFYRSWQGRPLRSALLSFPSYMCLIWRIPMKRQLPWVFLRKVRSRIGERIRA
jgi:hypothetical protein